MPPVRSALFAPREIRDRIFELLRASKDRSTGDWVRRHGTGGAFRLSQSLLNHVWPKIRDVGRTEDLRDLVELRQRLNRASTRRR